MGNALATDFDKFYDEQSPRVRALCNAYDIDSDDADDICQEVMISLWKSGDAFRQDCSMDTWVSRVAENKIRDFLRANSTFRDVITVSNELVEAYADEHTPGDIYAKRELFEILVDHISHLPEGDQEIIYMYNDGYTYGEIATRLGLTVGQVDGKLKRIKDRLRNETRGIA